MTVNGLPEQVYALEHYNYDTFSWLMSYDEAVRRARVLFYDAEYYLVEFRASGGGGSQVDGILWVGDGNFPGVSITLTKETNQDTVGKNWATGMVLWLGGLLFALLGVTVARQYSRMRQSGGYQQLHAEGASL